MCIICEHQAHHHGESGCKLTTCSCIKFEEKKLMNQEEKREKSEKSPTQNIREKTDKWAVNLNAFKTTTSIKIKQESPEVRQLSQSEIWDEVEANWDKIDKLNDDEEYEEIDKEIDIILGKKFENISAWIKKGHNYINLKKYSNAISCYHNVLILDKKNDNNLNNKNYEILRFIGRAHNLNTDNEKAIKFFNNSLKIKEDFILAINDLGLLYRDSYEYELAIEQFKKLLSIDENNIDGLDHVGYCYEYKGEYDKAIEYYNRSIQVEGKNDRDNYADVRLARCYLFKKDLEHAERLINKEKITGNEKNRSYEIRAMIYRDMKKFDKAIQNFEKYLLSNPNDSSILYAIAWCYGELNNHVFAIEYYKMRIDRSGPDKNASFAIGYELEAMGRREEANEWYEQQLLEFPQDIDMLENKGLNCRTLGKLQESIKCWDKLLEITPNDAWVLLKKSHDLEKIGKIEDALQSLEEIISADRKEDDPKEETLLNSKAWMLIKHGKEKEGMKYVEQSLKINPTNPNSLDTKAVGLFDLKKYEEAKKCYEQKYQITNVELDQIWIGICMKCWGNQVEENQSESKKHYDDAIKIYDLVLEKNNQSDETWFQKARVNMDLDNYDKAAENCQEAIKINPNDTRYWEEMADAVRSQGRSTQAMIYYNKANELQTSSYCLTEIAYCHSGNKNYEEAIVWANKSLEVESTLFAYSVKGNALNLQKKYEEAIVCYDECLKIDSNNIDALSDKGNAFRRWGKYEEAIENFNKSIKLKSIYWPYARKCNTYRDWKKYEEAIEVAENMLKQFPNEDKNTIEIIIEIYKKMNNEDKVKEFNEKLEKLEDLE